MIAANGGETIAGGAGADTTPGAGGEETRTAEEIALANALAKVPGADETYAWQPNEVLSRFVPQGLEDPAVKAIAEGFKEQGRDQGAFNTAFEALQILADKGVIAPPFDAAAELAKLGDAGGVTAEQRRNDVETYADSLLARGDLDAEEAAELKSFAPTAAGVRLIEKMRKWMADDKGGINPGGEGGDAKDAAGYTAAQREAQKMSEDPRYKTDFAFKREADRAWKTAFGD